MSAQNSGRSHSNEYKRRVLLHAVRNIRKTLCTLCHCGHYIFDCKTFKSLSVCDRWGSIKLLRLCFFCLQGGYTIRYCHRWKIYRANESERVHNKLLTEPSKITLSPQPVENPPSKTTATTVLVFSCIASTIKNTESVISNRSNYRAHSLSAFWLSLYWMKDHR